MKALATTYVVISEKSSALGKLVYLSIAVRHPETRRDMQRLNKVEIHMREMCWREVETHEREPYVPRYLGMLAGRTRTWPCNLLTSGSTKL
jgi:hypothetical protein